MFGINWRFTIAAAAASGLVACGTNNGETNNGSSNNGSSNNGTVASNNGTAGSNNGTTAGTNNGTTAGTNNGTTAGTNNGTTAGTNNGTTAGTNNGTTTGTAWTIRTHTCVGNRTDALWCDDMNTCWVGCGTTTNGEGLFGTTDGGQAWSAATTTPANFFDTGRVNSISRSADGNLYIGGTFANSAAVVALDGAGALTEVFTRSNQIDFSFTVGQFRRNADGWAIAESATGTGIVYREGDDAEPTDSWSTGYQFWADNEADDVPNGVQILDLETYDGGFYGVGSLINQPPTVFLPDWTAGSFDFHIVQLAADGLGAYDGELWGIDVDAGGIVVGGVNQDADQGVIYAIDLASDATDPSAWTMTDVSSVIPNQTTWVTDVCRDDQTIYAVGRESSEEWGFVLMSNDGGATFSDITPYEMNGESPLPDVSRCQIVDGTLVVAGAGGLFATYE